jgi:thiol-disulfide isomerase/thioredoxin
MNKRFLTTAVILGLLFGALGLYFGLEKMTPKKPQNGAIQQLFKLSLTDSRGQTQKIAQWEGKILVVNFWATWCAPCVKEMPELSALQKELEKNNVQLLGLGIDSPSNIADFSSKYQISYPLFSAGMEGTELSRQFGNQAGGLPFTVLIASDGSLAKSYLGRLNIEELRVDITKLSK